MKCRSRNKAWLGAAISAATQIAGAGINYLQQQKANRKKLQQQYISDSLEMQNNIGENANNDLNNYYDRVELIPQFPYGGNTNLKPNIVRGGHAIGLGNNLYLMSGRKHSQGGIDIGKNPKTGIEVEGNEVVQITPSSLRVFSAQPILGGISPAEYILGGANPNKVFAAQENWKRINRVDDDGTKKAKFGTKANNERKVIGYGNNFDSRLRYLDLDQKLVAYINKIAKDYNISPALLTNRLFHEGAIDNAIKNYDNSVKKGIKVNSLLDSNHIDNDSYNLYGLDDSYTLLKNGKLKLNRNIPVTSKFRKNEKGRIVNYAGTSDPYDAIELMASNISYIKNEMQNKFPNIKDRDLDTITNKAFNIGLYGAIDDVKNNGVGSKYIIDDRLYNYNYNNDFYLKNNNRNDIINTFTIESQNNLFNDYKDIYKNDFIKEYGEEFNDPTNSSNFLKNKITRQGDSAEEYSNYKADKTFKDTYFYPLGTDYSYNNPFFKIKTEFKYGGIHIKPSKRGTFTAAAKKHGMGVQAFASKVLANKDNYSPAMVKKANFARNASKWNHKEFGGNMDFNYIIGKNNIYKLGGRRKAPTGLGIYFPTTQDIHLGLPLYATNQNYDNEDYENGIIYNRYGPRFNTFLDESVVVADRINKIPDLTSANKQNEDYIENLNLDDNINIPDVTLNLDSNLKVRPMKYRNRDKGYKSNDLKGDKVTFDRNRENRIVNPNGRIGSDEIGLGINLLGNLASSLINNKTINSLDYGNAPTPLRAVKLKTKYNINPQLDNIREEVARGENDVTQNTASSKTALSRRQSLRGRGLQYANQLEGQKENIETELINRDRFNQQQVGNRNIERFDNWYRGLVDFENNRRNLKAENAVAGINNAADAIAGPQGYIAHRERRLDNDMKLNRDLLDLKVLSLLNPNAKGILDPEIKKAFDEYERLLRRRRGTII